jgi:hypothetical protein
VIDTNQKSSTGRRVVDLRQPARPATMQPSTLSVYQATDDASYSSGQWSVPAKRVNLDGTLDGDAQSRAAITVYLDGGDPNPTFPPVRNHQRFVLVTTADGVRAAFVSNLRDALSLQTRADNGRLEIDGWSTRAVTTVVAEDALVVRRVVDDQRVVRYVSVENLIAYIEENITIDYGDIENTPEIPAPHDGFNDGIDEIYRRHYLLSSLTERDDHTGGRTPVSGTTGKNVYLHPEGNATRNACHADMRIGDSANVESIDPNGRKLYRAAGAVAVDYTAMQAFDDAATPVKSVDWKARTLHDAFGEVAIDYENRRARTPAEIVAIIWTDDSCTLRDPSSSTAGVGKRSVDWKGRKAYEPDGETESFDWNEQQPHIADAETEHALDDTSLATLKADTEAALDAMGALVNELRDALRAYKIIAAPAP